MVMNKKGEVETSANESLGSRAGPVLGQEKQMVSKEKEERRGNEILGRMLFGLGR
jgi:hypothetical protein